MAHLWVTTPHRRDKHESPVGHVGINVLKKERFALAETDLPFRLSHSPPSPRVFFHPVVRRETLLPEQVKIFRTVTSSRYRILEDSLVEYESRLRFTKFQFTGMRSERGKVRHDRALSMRFPSRQIKRFRNETIEAGIREKRFASEKPGDRSRRNERNGFHGSVVAGSFFFESILRILRARWCVLG